MAQFKDNKFIGWIGKIKVNYDFLLLTLILLISNWHYLSKAFFPIHDTLEVFTFFHYFYSEWFTRGEIPQWFPHVTYGVPTNFYQLRNITPVYYVFMLVGKLFSVKDVIFLYKMSVLGEQCIFLMGMYKLSRYLFKQRSTVFMVCLSSIAGIIWHSAINFNFRLYALFPFVIYLLLLFFEKKEEGFLWLAGIACLSGAMGVTIYFLGLWAIVYLFFAAALLVMYKDSFKRIFRLSKRNIFFCLGFILFVALALLYIKSSIDALRLVSLERKASGATTLSTFLNYGRLPSFSSILQGLFFANADIKVGVPYDNTIYMGLFPLGFLIWSFFHVRTRYYYLFLGVALMLVWLSFGGIFSALTYRFPGVAYYRHLGHVYSLVKILLIICAGYGMEHFFEASRKRKVIGAICVLATTLILFDIFMNGNHNFVSPELGVKGFLDLWDFMKWSYLGPLVRGSLKYVSLGAIFLVVIIFSQQMKGFKRYPIKMFVKGGILFLLFCDLFMFQQIVNEGIPKISQENYSWLESAKVRVAEYQPFRSLEITKPEQKDAYELVMLSNPTAKYVSAYNFVQFDRCDPGFRVDLASEGVLELISIPNIKRAIIGCYYPKMRLVPSALFSNDLIDLAKVANNYEAFKKIVVLKPEEEDKRFVQLGHDTLDPRNTVKVTDFSPNEVKAQVNVYDEKGNWLIYADAFNPQWKAFVDGKPVMIHRAYLAFKSIFLPKGNHSVIFKFSSLPKIKGGIVAAWGLLAGLVLLSLFFREFFRHSEG